MAISNRSTLFLRALLVFGLWYVNSTVSELRAEGADSCWYLCGNYQWCGTSCTVGNEQWTTCGEAGYGCSDGYCEAGEEGTPDCPTVQCQPPHPYSSVFPSFCNTPTDCVYCQGVSARCVSNRCDVLN